MDPLSTVLHLLLGCALRFLVGLLKKPLGVRDNGTLWLAAALSVLVALGVWVLQGMPGPGYVVGVGTACVFSGAVACNEVLVDRSSVGGEG